MHHFLQVENKKQKKEGHELPEKVVLTEAEIEKQASDYLLSRFALSNGEVPLPPPNEGTHQRQVMVRLLSSIVPVSRCTKAQSVLAQQELW